MIYCDNCKNKIVMHAFSNGTCEVCGDDIFCSHTPSDLVCNNCGVDFNLCESCGNKIETNEKSS